MRKSTFDIARIELYNLFYSPVAWFILAAFLFQTGSVYTSIMEALLAQQKMGGYYLENMHNLTQTTFTDITGLFSVVGKQLYLFVPLLTMGLIAREINNGTIKLLYASPVKVREIVLGKFLAMMVFNLLFIGIAGIFVVAAIFNIAHLETAMLLAGLLGLYLLLGAFSAIGLFLSCLTSYQIVAAIGTMVTLGLLNYMGTVWQQYDFFRDLTYSMSMIGRLDNLMSGLITTKDLIYFFLIICLFLSFSIYYLRGLRETVTRAASIRRYGLALLVVVAIGYISSRPACTGYLDVTAHKANTLTPTVQKIVRDMNEAPLEITAYCNLLDIRWQIGGPANRNLYLRQWEKYQRFKSDIHYKFVYYYDSTSEHMPEFTYHPEFDLPKLARWMAKNEKARFKIFETPQQIRRQIDLRPEHNRFVMQLKYKGKTTFLRIFEDQDVWPGETEIAAALKRLQAPQVPVIAFVTGDGERSIEKMGDREYMILPNMPTFRHALINQGFDVTQVSLHNQEIPTGISALVLADPRMPPDSLELGRLQRYISGGGNLLIAVDGSRRSVPETLLHSLGIQIKEGSLLQRSNDFTPDLVLPQLTNAGAGLLKVLTKFKEQQIPVTMPGAVALRYDIDNGFDVRSLLETDSSASWLSHTQENQAESGSFPTALSLSRTVNSRKQHIIVTGNADFMSNAELTRKNVKNANFLFATGLFSWLTDGQYPVNIMRPEGTDNRLLVTDAGIVRMKSCFEFILPALLVIAAAIVLIRRKRK